MTFHSKNQLSEGKEFKAVFTNACRSKLDASQDSLVLLSGGLIQQLFTKQFKTLQTAKRLVCP